MRQYPTYHIRRGLPHNTHLDRRDHSHTVVASAWIQMRSTAPRHQQKQHNIVSRQHTTRCDAQRAAHEPHRRLRRSPRRRCRCVPVRNPTRIPTLLRRCCATRDRCSYQTRRTGTLPCFACSLALLLYQADRGVGARTERRGDSGGKRCFLLSLLSALQFISGCIAVGHWRAARKSTSTALPLA